ncbi:MAG: hypothetical protein ABI723_07460 [Bacteroidia bacterium]
MRIDTDTNIKDDLSGNISIKFKDGISLDEYCSNNIENYNPDRFEALAIRVYYGKETTVTLYAIDKERLEGNNFNKDKMPVKKFKLNNSFLQNILTIIDEGNFTLATGNYPLSDMEVINR